VQTDGLVRTRHNKDWELTNTERPPVSLIPLRFTAVYMFLQQSRRDIPGQKNSAMAKAVKVVNETIQ
jgi:hypothetical protein